MPEFKISDARMSSVLQCDGWCEHRGEVSMMDNKGYVYCGPCGLRRRQYTPCRKLRPGELAKLHRGEQLARY